jgi:hypothetical protein
MPRNELAWTRWDLALMDGGGSLALLLIIEADLRRGGE